MYIPYEKLSRGKEIGGGTFADVFHGTWDSETGRLAIAIKVLKERDIPSEYTQDQARERMEKRFNRELEVWQRLSHPNVLEFSGYSIAPEPNRAYIFVSPLRSQGNLSDYVDRNPNWSVLSATQRLKLAIGVSLGVDYLHSHSDLGPIYHGDIKPNNIVLLDDLTPQLCDFGLARVLSDTLSKYSTSGGAAGSAHFQPYEVWLTGTGSLPGDIFSFAGVVLLIMSSIVPYSTIHPELIARTKLVSGTMPDPAEHPLLPASDPLWELMRACWAKDPTERPSIGPCIEELRNGFTRYSG